jgi:hypothetical protein
MKLVAAAIGLQACLTVSLLTAQQQQAPQQQTITFDTIAAQVAGGSVTLSAKATSGLPVSFASSTPAVCTVSGTTATLLSAGTCTIQASQAGNTQYAAAPPVPVKFTVDPISQTITFTAIPAQVVGASVVLSAWASSGLPVSFASSTPAVCSVSGTTVTLIIAGTCIVQASQAGTPKYAVVTPASQSIATAAQPATSQKKNGTSGSQTTQYTSIANGGKLSYGKSVTLTGQTSDLKCGSQAISGLIDISGISASFLGQTSAPSTGTINGTTWTAPLGSLPADATINLQLKITGKLSDAAAVEVTNELLGDARFLSAVNGFFAATNETAKEGSKDQPSRIITSAMANQEAQMVLDSISAKNGALTQILGRLLPSCAVVTDVTTVALIGLRAHEPALLNLPNRVADLRDSLPSLDPSASPADAYEFVQTLKIDPKDPNASEKTDTAKYYKRDYEAILGAFKVDVVAQLSQGVELTQVTDTADLNKYAGFDAGAMYVPRINELRQFDMVHIYPFGPVELDTNGGVPMKARWSIALGASIGDLSSNGKSRIKSDKAFVYGVGFRINKYFRVSAGGMVYRDAIGNGLLNELFIGPSIDITALPGLKQIFSSSSGTGGNASSKSNAAGKSNPPSAAPNAPGAAPSPANGSNNQ